MRGKSMAKDPAPDKRAAKKRNESRYLEIADDLQRRVEADEFAEGYEGNAGQLPPIGDLATSYGVAAGTVRNALAQLRAQGVLDMKQGRGTFVRTWQPTLRDANKRLSREHWGSGKAIWAADLADDQRRGEKDVVVYATMDAPVQYRELLGADRVLIRDRVYTIDAKRIMWARSYLPADLVAGTQIVEHDTGAGGTFQRLAEIGQAPVRFSEEVTVRRPTFQEQAKLGINSDDPVAHIVRLNATDDDRIVEVTDMVAVGEAYRFRWTFTA
jgi:GntR family transcriptional regulator